MASIYYPISMDMQFYMNGATRLRADIKHSNKCIHSFPYLPKYNDFCFHAEKKNDRPKIARSFNYVQFFKPANCSIRMDLSMCQSVTDYQKKKNIGKIGPTATSIGRHSPFRQYKSKPNSASNVSKRNSSEMYCWKQAGGTFFHSNQYNFHTN